MLTEHAELFDDYWRAITRSEAFIRRYPELNETEFHILQAMDEIPRMWTEIAVRAGYQPHTVRRYSTKLQKAGLIKKTKRGFIRTVRLPSDPEEGAEGSEQMIP